MAVGDKGKSEYVDSLRLTSREHAEILKELDGRQAKGLEAERRGEQRLRFAEQALLFVQLRHPGGTVGSYLVRTRNLSRTGIGFLHGGFVYSGTPCTVALRTVDKAMVEIDGRIVRCAHVRGHVHEVGVRFGKPIRLREFLGRHAPPDTEDATSSELPRLQGRVLYVEDSASDQELFKFHLANLGLTCDVASGGLDALEMAESVRYDLIVSGICLPGMSGFEVAESLRQGGYRGPLVALTADERDDTRVEALGRGFGAVLSKPYPFEDLLRVLATHLVPAVGTTSEVVASELWGNVAMRPLIGRYLERLAGQIAELRRVAGAAGAVGAEPLLRKMYLELKGSAGGYGYPQVSRAAQEVLAALAEAGASGVSPVVRERHEALVRLCEAAVGGAGGPVAAAAEGVTTAGSGATPAA